MLAVFRITYLQNKVNQLNLKENLYVGEIPQITWSDVAGLNAEKDALSEYVALSIKYSNLFPNKKNSWKNILLLGVSFSLALSN